MALIPICHTPKPRIRRKRLGAGDVMQVPQHINNIVQTQHNIQYMKGSILHNRNVISIV